jgi:hypothetical protein
MELFTAHIGCIRVRSGVFGTIVVSFRIILHTLFAVPRVINPLVYSPADLISFRYRAAVFRIATTTK